MKRQPPGPKSECRNRPKSECRNRPVFGPCCALAVLRYIVPPCTPMAAYGQMWASAGFLSCCPPPPPPPPPPPAAGRPVDRERAVCGMCDDACARMHAGVCPLVPKFLGKPVLKSGKYAEKRIPSRAEKKRAFGWFQRGFSAGNGKAEKHFPPTDTTTDTTTDTPPAPPPAPPPASLDRVDDVVSAYGKIFAREFPYV